MEIRLRPATSDDAGALAAVELTCCRAAERGLLPDAFLDGLPEAKKTVDWRQNLLRHGPSGGKRVYVAVDDAGVIGFGRVGPSWDECEVGLVYLLYVLPAEHMKTVTAADPRKRRGRIPLAVFVELLCSEARAGRVAAAPAGASIVISE